MSDSSQICDYQFLSIIVTNQSTNIEYNRILWINQLHFDDQFVTSWFCLAQAHVSLTEVGKVSHVSCFHH